MTDNEIIKALEHEIHIANDIGGVHSMMIPIEPIKCALDLINRQQAEIERLQKRLDDKCDMCIARDKTEAIKEFAELVKMEFYKEFDELIPSLMADRIDNLVKEMTESVNYESSKTEGCENG